MLKILSAGKELSLESIFGGGELLLIGAAISAAAIGELVVGNTYRKKTKLTISGACIFLLALNSLWFADVSSARMNQTTYDYSIVASGSVIMFLVTLLVSGLCIALSEVTE
jgi:hypothetical protein